MTELENIEAILNRYLPVPIAKVTRRGITTDLTALIRKREKETYNKGYSQCAADVVANIKKDGTGEALGHQKERTDG